jgi:hypothetical protein
VTIIGTQPHTAATQAIAESVAMSSLPVNAFGSDNSSKRVNAAEKAAITTATTAR